MNFHHSKSLLGALLCLATLTACNSLNAIEGKFITYDAFGFVDNSSKSQALPGAHAYDAILHMNEKGSLLEIKTALFQSNQILLPNPVQNQTGDFTISPTESHQSFETQGSINIENKQVETSGLQSCTLGYQNQYVCNGIVTATSPVTISYPVVQMQNLYGNPQQCYWTQVTILGHQFVQETLVVTDKNVNLKFLEPTTQKVLGVFDGSFRLSTRTLSHIEGDCTQF